MSIIIYQSPECNTPEDVNLHEHHCRNLKYHMMYLWQKLYFCFTFVLASPSFPSNGKDFISKNVLITGGFLTYILKNLKSRILFQPLLTSSSARILKNCYLSPLLFCQHSRGTCCLYVQPSWRWKQRFPPNTGKQQLDETVLYLSISIQVHILSSFSLVKTWCFFIFPFCTTLNMPCTWHCWW